MRFGAAIMLVDHDGVKADLLGKHEFGEITLVERRPLLWVVEFVRKIHPNRMIVFVVFRQMRIRHEMHEIEAHSVAHESLPVTTQKRVTRTGALSRRIAVSPTK
jgi:hypothetical protein